MSCRLVIGRYGYKVVADTVTGSADDADYPASYLVDGNVARPAKLTTTTGSYVFDFGTAQRIDQMAFGPHNLQAGLSNVLLQGNATDSWGAPSFSATVVIPPYREDLQSVNPWLDLTLESDYIVGGFRYWRLSVGTANVAPVAIGEVALYSQIDSFRNFRIGVVESDRIPAVIHATTYGVETVYPLGVQSRRLSGELYFQDSDLASFLSVWRGGFGQGQWHTVVLSDAANDARFVRFDNDELSVSHLGNGNHRVGLSFVELSRGLYL